MKIEELSNKLVDLLKTDIQHVLQVEKELKTANATLGNSNDAFYHRMREQAILSLISSINKLDAIVFHR